MAEPNWSDFRIILALSNGGSVTGAAKLLGVDASTVSRRLAAAEDAFGAVLIIRGGGVFRFTAEGQAILDAARAMDTTISETTSSVRSMRQTLTGPVRIACVQTAVHVLRPLADEVARAHPDLRLEIMSSIAPVDLVKGEADIAVRTIAPKDPGLVIAHAFTWGSCLYASKDYLATQGRPETAGDLAAHQLVRYGTPLLPARAFGWIEQFADPDRPATRVENTDSARIILEQGGGIGALFCVVGDGCVNLERVFPDPFDQMESWVLYHESARGSARVRAVLDSLVAYLKARRGWLSGLDGAD
ncbi:LysR family transcriptional regulator [Cognatishimia sp. F0-27]|uniref:LysR family transcriptional regulator n=1 Tax=Cognatishimia sp. F0-27 TaxID=2816855 RepID=UPI001D0C8984|nr:LysR family transcriptional regulator [Cognatishimia sp. F0-27]MCC1492626.1 LysR family transcriptional regulator [Cognatishimia sp. F0-27]